MQTFDQSLLGLYREDLITYETARDAATNPDDFDLKVKGIFSTGEMTWEVSSQPQGGKPGAAPAAAPGRPSGSGFFKRT
jgi:Tfp pilus assembly ATPase PilU